MIDATPDEPDDTDDDDVAGHLRMTDEQLAAGTTPREAMGETPRDKEQRDAGR